MAKQQIQNGARTGGLMVSVWCKAPIGRIYKSTGLLPTDRNAAAIAVETAEMLRALNRAGDIETLRKIKMGSRKGGVGMLEALYAYRQNAQHTLTGGGRENLLAALREYVANGPQKPSTRRRLKYNVSALVTHKLLNDKHIVNDLPKIVEAMRRFYEKRSNPDMFNNTKNFLLGFIQVGLNTRKSSLLYTSVTDIKPLRVAERKAHHPFVSPRDMLVFIEELMGRDGIDIERRSLYAEAIFTICCSGFRPEEYTGRRFRHDGKTDFGTGHLLIAGTKTAQSVRVVPKLVFPKLVLLHYLSVAALNKSLSKVGNGKVRMRDFRRTYAIWCEKAGLESSAIARYLGHKQKSGFAQTAHYIRHKPTVDELNADMERLASWISAEVATIPANTKAAWAAQSLTGLEKMFSVYDAARVEAKTAVD